MSAIEEVKQYLTAHTIMRGGTPDGLRFNSYEALVLAEGVVFTEYGKPVSPGVPKACYANAYRLATRYPAKYTYVEGWAASTTIPMQHAWVIDPDGRVIDPTWGHRIDAAYLGIPFPIEAVRETHKLTKGNFSMLYPMTHRHPLLTKDNTP